MTGPRDPDAIIANWLEDGPVTLPVETRQAIEVGSRTMPAARRSMHLGGITMTSLSRVAGVAAIVMIVGSVAGFVVANRGHDAGQPVATSQPIGWTSAAVNADWPGPVRVERSGDPEWIGVTTYADPVGDVDGAPGWIDITSVALRTGTNVVFSNRIGLELAAGLAQVPQPTADWIAYGVVLDIDGDGVPDQRIGIDNSAADHREWITDLATGQTAKNVSGVFGAFGAFGTRIETWFANPNGSVGLIVKRTTGGSRMYAWASLIVGNTIVATDYAPDAGWIVTTSP
jgi:hypothetical protein